jgi:hypothetical protein
MFQVRVLHGVVYVKLSLYSFWHGENLAVRFCRPRHIVEPCKFFVYCFLFLHFIESHNFDNPNNRYRGHVVYTA